MIKASTLSTYESLCFWPAYDRRGVLSLGLQQFGVGGLSVGVLTKPSNPYPKPPKPYTLNSLNPKLRT